MVFGLITYLESWKWLWGEWITTVDPKRIGIMYIVVALIMFFKGFADALMMRLQQALSVGDSHGFISAKPLSGDFFRPRHDDDLFRRDGICFWADESYHAAANWSAGCRVSIFKLLGLLAFCRRGHV